MHAQRRAEMLRLRVMMVHSVSGCSGTHLQGPHQSVCWLRPKRARHFLGEPGSEPSEQHAGNKKNSRRESKRKTERKTVRSRGAASKTERHRMEEQE